MPRLQCVRPPAFFLRLVLRRISTSHTTQSRAYCWLPALYIPIIAIRYICGAPFCVSLLALRTPRIVSSTHLRYTRHNILLRLFVVWLRMLSEIRTETGKLPPIQFPIPGKSRLAVTACLSYCQSMKNIKKTIGITILAAAVLFALFSVNRLSKEQSLSETSGRIKVVGSGSGDRRHCLVKSVV